MNGTPPRKAFADREPRLDGVPLLVVGLGRSGLAAVRLATAHGAVVTATDSRDEAALGEAAASARAAGARVAAGGHPAGLLDRAELLVLSPGVPPEIELLRLARDRAIPIWSEVELAARFCRGAIVGITGSNGKSTVTTMIGGILRGAGVAGGTGGNLATPFSELLEHDGPRAVHALELSSFQLEAVHVFRARVAAILNLSPDHLDRYRSIEEYAAAKARILERQDEGDAAILNADDPASDPFRRRVRGKLHLFSTVEEVACGAYLRDGAIALRTAAGDETVLDARELPVPGRHNVANALAAALACRLAGVAPSEIAAGLRRFRALPHRLEPVGTVRGVRFFNDSKATNLDSAARALESFEPGTVHVILGGKDKGASWDDLAPLLRRHARRALLVGKSTAELQRRLEGTTELVECGTIGRAVAEGFAGARAGEVVLLAPGCASFDQYRNFEERGDDFRAAVERLGRAEGDDA